MKTGKYTLKLNSTDKLEALLQEAYDDAVKQINLINERMNDLKESTTLKDETIDMKAKYSKALHDFIMDLDKAKSRKIDIAKLMSEVIKNNGDVHKVLTDDEIVGSLDFSELKKQMENEAQSFNETQQTEEYITNKPKKNG